MHDGNRSFRGLFDFCQGRKSYQMRSPWASLPFTAVILVMLAKLCLLSAAFNAVIDHDCCAISVGKTPL